MLPPALILVPAWILVLPMILVLVFELAQSYFGYGSAQALRQASRPVPSRPVIYAIPILFKHLISLYVQNSRTGPFSLTNRDFRAHSLLVNDDFEIIGVIDLDGVMAAPIEVVAQYPSLTGLEREPPGHVETRPFAINHIKITEPKLKEYKNLVEIAEAGMGGSKNGEESIANLMLSNATSVYQGLLRYAGRVTKNS